jgi:hypothetical protein
VNTQTELLEYITEGIIKCLDKKDISVPSEAADDIVQLALLREYIELKHFSGKRKPAPRF